MTNFSRLHYQSSRWFTDNGILKQLKATSVVLWKGQRTNEQQAATREDCPGETATAVHHLVLITLTRVARSPLTAPHVRPITLLLPECPACMSTAAFPQSSRGVCDRRNWTHAARESAKGNFSASRQKGLEMGVEWVNICCLPFFPICIFKIS